METAAKRIRKYCLEFCMNNQANEVKLCTSPECSLYPYRLGRKSEDTKLSRIKSIRARCKDCEPENYPKYCDETECHLYPYREGKNPNRKGLDTSHLRR